MAGVSLVPVVGMVTIMMGLTWSMQMTQYRDPDSNDLQNMAVDAVTGNIYIGGTNSLAMLSKDLTLQQHVSMQGGKVDVVSKGILVDRTNGQLVFCTSLSGTCEFHSLTDINRVLQIQSNQIVPNEKLTGNLIFPLSDGEHVFVANNFKKNVNGTLSNFVHTISSRKMVDLNLTYSDNTGFSLKDILQSVPAGFFVQYIYGFSFSDYVYLIAVQPRKLDNPSQVVTKIIRICKDDKYMRSYVEVPLDCLLTASVQYKEATSAFFESSAGKIYVGFTRNGHDSALCVYDVKDINSEMDGTMQSCFQGNGLLGPKHIHKKQSCVPTSTNPGFCGQSDVSEAYPAIMGTRPVFKRPVIDFPDFVVSAVLAKVESLYTVVYLGTSTGFLKKVTFASDGTISVVKEVSLDVGKGIKSPMFFNQDFTAVYAMTSSKVSRVEVDHCEEKSSCQECIAMADPICGWCVLENRCTKEEACPNAAINPTWLPASSGACAAMQDIQPNILNYETLDTTDSQRVISFRLDRISVVDPEKTELHCTFVAKESRERTKATIINDKVTCPLPPRTKLPLLPEGKVKANEDHGTLEVEFQVEGRTVVKRDVSLFDCTANQNCTSCTQSAFGCKWCHVRGLCVEVSTPTCPDQTVTGIQSAASCPRLETTAKDKDILVHSGQTKKIAVRVANLQVDQESNIHCLFSYEGTVKVALGTISSSNLICEPLEFSFNNTGWPIVTATFQVTSGKNSQLLDNPQDIKVRIYKCPLMVTNCGQCLSMDPEYECGWCDSDCRLQSECQAGKWLDRSTTCKDPQILRFNPSTGPIEGKTNISVTGINLGKTHTDLVVTVAGVKCSLHAQHYEASSGFVCETEGPGQTQGGAIKVVINKMYSTDSNSHFEFVEPEVTDLSPARGPMSGGTTLAIYGENMNTGTATTVDVGGSSCQVVRSNYTSLVCVTSQHVSNERSVDVEVTFGGGNGLRKLLTGTKFTYEKDPEISMIEPKKTILSGGTRITVMSNHMQFIQNPEFFVELGTGKITSKCDQYKQSLLSWLVCRTPALDFPGENVSVTNPREVHYGFNLDGVTTYRNISADPNFGPLLYFPDPMVERFPPVGDGMKKFEKDHKLVIKGKFRSLSPIMTDVNVTVGGIECIKPASTDDAISCVPPKKPPGIDNNGNARVLLQIGNMEMEVGAISYYEVEEPDKPIAIGIILGVVLPIIAIIILLTICVVRRHRKHKPSENYIPDVLKDYEGMKEDEEMGMNHVSVKADMNGSIPDDKDTGPYIEELLGKVEDEAVKQNIRDFLILRRMLDIGELLGKGNFGVTCKATYSQSVEENPTDVAVKTLQGTQTDNDNVAVFLQTCAKYKDLQHPGVSPILGLCITASDDPMLVLPYAQNGDLKSYVRDSNRDLMVIELLDMAEQVAEAMAYLESVHVVHGNLAARNCLVSSDKKVHVSEYGLTEDLFSKDQYLTENGKTKNLVKWMAPEAIDNLNFDSRSDVWSYGIVLWELLTRGVTPYPDVDNSELRDYLETGNRVKKPRTCPENIYELMLRCWAQAPDVRPSFRQIADEIHAFLSTEHSEEETQGDTVPLKTSIDVGASAEFI